MSETKMEEMRRKARRVLGEGCTDDEVERHAKHLYARHLSGGATIGQANGRLVIERDPLPPANLPDRKPLPEVREGLASGYDLHDQAPSPYDVRANGC